MDIQDFISKTPYLYHLTDRRNLEFIKKEKRLFSTVEIINMAALEKADEFLRAKRPEHTMVKINGNEWYIRDQRPLNKALNKCLTDNWMAGDFVLHLNSRVFFWPNLGRLQTHFGRYESENPIILRFSTEEILKINEHVELANINSGATRPSGALGGKAAARGKDTFKKIMDCDYPIGKVAEVTVPGYCILPKRFQTSNSPRGPWR